MLQNAAAIVEHLRELQGQILQAILKSRSQKDLHQAHHTSAADTIYRIDALIEPVIEGFCEQWGRQLPMVVIAEGLEPETGRVFPEGAKEEDAVVRVILDPIDGTRGLMYDKRSAWSLAGVAPNKGAQTRLSDIEVAMMTELPTSKMGYADVLWAIKGQGAQAERIDLKSFVRDSLHLQPSAATSLEHGFISVISFFPGTKLLAAEAMEYLARHLTDYAEACGGGFFHDEYISTGGQFYELIAGHDLFIADVRPLFYRVLKQPMGLCAHPYDCATMLIAQEAGVVLTDGVGGALDGPLDATTGLAWVGYANRQLEKTIAPVWRELLRSKGV